MDVTDFQAMPTEDLAELVRSAGPLVCAFPVNGTRRWLVLEHADEAGEDFQEAYLRLGGQRYIELCELCFGHGIDTLLTPVFGPELLGRGDEYKAFILSALEWLGRSPEFLEFCKRHDVRVRTYGDTRRHMKGTEYEDALSALEKLCRATQTHRTHRLFVGVCAHDATESVAEIAVGFHQRTGRLPNRREIVEAYYGEYVDAVDLFIGFDRFAAFDMPLVATGAEDLYFTVSPSPYVDTSSLRAILYDHLYARPGHEGHYWALSNQELEWMRSFYRENQGNVVGVGTLRAGVWYPLPQVEMPAPQGETAASDTMPQDVL